MMTSRSGSSLVASIFAAHGFNYGDEFDHPFNYHTRESVTIKKWVADVKSAAGYQNGEFCKPLDELPPHDVSLIKIGVEYWPLFKPLNWHVVTVYRNPANIVRSVMAKNPGDLAEVTALTHRRMEMMEQVRREANGAEVNADEIMAGDFSSVSAAFEHFGLPFDEAKARACVEPSKWHFR